MLSVLLYELIRLFVQFITDKTVQSSTQNVVLTSTIGLYYPSISHGICTVHLFNLPLLLNDTELAHSDPVKRVIGL